MRTMKNEKTRLKPLRILAWRLCIQFVLYHKKNRIFSQFYIQDSGLPIMAVISSNMNITLPFAGGHPSCFGYISQQPVPQSHKGNLPSCLSGL